MKSFSRVLVPAFLLVASPSLAQVSAPSGENPGELRLKVHSQLPAAPARHGVAAHFTEATAYFWGCLGPCHAGDKDALVVELPDQAVGKKRRVKNVGTKEAPVLWVRWGSDEAFYSMVVMGARTDDEGGRPQLVLKGWAGEKSESGMTLVEGEGGSLTLASAPERALCGRRLPSRTRVLRAEEGRFVEVRAPALTLPERKGAKTIQGTPVERLESTLVGLSATASRASSTVVDADRTAPWRGGHEWIELQIPEGAHMPLALEFAEPLKEPTALYVVSDEQVYQVEFSPSESKLYFVDLEQESPSCIALVQPHTPAPLSEVMMIAGEGLRSTEQLVAELEKGDVGLAGAALRVRGKEAGALLGSRYSKMSPLARARAFDIAEVLPAGSGLPVFVSAVEIGSAHQERAIEALRAAGEDGMDALFERLPGAAEVAAGRLIVALTNLDSPYVAEKFPPLLGDAQDELRAKLRAALGHVAKTKRGRAALERWFERAPAARLSGAARFELVRALGPQLGEIEGGLAALVSLADGADFRQAYLLTPWVVERFNEEPKLQRALSRWLLGQAEGKLSAEEQAALSVRVLDSVLEGGDDAMRVTLGPGLAASLGAENMRVRRAALLNLAQTGPKTSVPAGDAVELLNGDDWPQVRAAAAAAVVPLSGGKMEARTERVMLRRLSKDDDATVRRAVVRALADASGQEVVEGVRRSFERDADYSVRAEAAVTLGKLCDESSLDALTARARELGSLTDEGAIELGLSSVTALAYLVPDDINKRLAPLLSDKAPRVTRTQVKRRIEAVRASEDHAVCAR